MTGVLLDVLYIVSVGIPSSWLKLDYLNGSNSHHYPQPTENNHLKAF